MDRSWWAGKTLVGGGLEKTMGCEGDGENHGGMKMLEKSICLFLSGWLASAKKELNNILFEHVSSLFQNSKYFKMFEDYNICIVFKNDTRIKNLIVKRK